MRKGLLGICTFLAINILGTSHSATTAAGSVENPQGPAHSGTIVLEKQFTIGEREGQETLVWTADTMLAADPQGSRFYVAPTADRGEVAVLDSSGTLLSTIGGFGEGPGELGFVATLFVDPEDNLHVFQFPRAHTVFDAKHEFVRTVKALSAPYWALFLSKERSVRNLSIRTPAAAGMPLHLVEGDEEVIVRSFGADPAEVFRATDETTGNFRSIALSDDGTIWTARYDSYVLENWNLDDGHRLAKWEYAPPWWVADADPATWVVDISVRDGYLWVLASVPTYRGERPPDVDRADPILSDYYDTVIEVVDPASGTLVASVRREERFLRWLGGRVYNHRETSNGGVAIDVWRVHLETVQGKRPVQ